jgi:hypothetical protein
MIRNMAQLGDEGQVRAEPHEVALQQLVVALYLIWDTLGMGYQGQAEMELMMLANWGKQYQVPFPQAIVMLHELKTALCEREWGHYIHCSLDHHQEAKQAGKEEGGCFSTVFVLNPRSSNDLLSPVRQLLTKYPFGAKKEGQ